MKLSKRSNSNLSRLSPATCDPLRFETAAWFTCDPDKVRIAPSIAFTTSGQLNFLMGVGWAPRATFFHDRPRTIQQPHTIQGNGSSGQDSQDYKHLFHEPAFYTNDVRSA